MIRKYLLRISLIVGFLAAVSFSYSQTLLGRTDVALGLPYTYVVNFGYGYPQFGGFPYDCETEVSFTFWDLIDAAGNNGLNFQYTLEGCFEAEILFPGTGTYTVHYEATTIDNFLNADLEVNVVDVFSYVHSGTCGSGLLARNASLSGQTWYWQGLNPNGEDTSPLAAAETYVTNATGTYYIRSRDNTTGVWSDPIPVEMLIRPLPPPPPAPSVSSNTCGNVTLTRSTPPPGGSGFNWGWYWQGTDPNGTNYSPLQTYTVTASGTYYLRAKAENYCWSAPTAVSVTVNPIPSVPPPPTVSPNVCGPRILTRANPPANETWYWQGEISGAQDMSSSATTYQPNTSGTYFIRSRHTTGCWGSETAVSVTVDNPPPPATPVVPTATCGPKIITKGTPPTNVGWYWQGLNSSSQDYTSLVATSPTYQATSSGTYYLGARGTGSCWAYTAIVVNVDPIDITVTSYDATNTVVQATHSITLLPGFTTPSGKAFTGRIAITSECNDFINWKEETAFDLNGTTVSNSKTYFDGLGGALQSQSKTFTTKKVFATQPLFNNFNEAAAATLPAPILENDFIYKKNFASNESGTTYGPNDFDVRTTTNAPQSGEINYPKTMGTQPGTVGWYYSSSNNLEPKTPVTQYPYSRSYTLEGPDPVTSKSASVGNDHRMGSGHEVTSERQLITTELSHYYSLRSHFVASPNNLTVPAIPGYKHISTDPNGKKAVAFTDADGRSVASATLTGSAYDNWSYTYYNDAGQVVATVAPNGVNTGSTADPSFVTKYKYDHLGQLIETTSPDDGTSKFVYSTDGKIRFSQNQEQRNSTPARFSYTNYDYLGRLIESGEYTMSGTGYYVFERVDVTAPVVYSVLTIADNTGFTGTTRKSDPNNRCTEYSYIEYDVQASDLPTGDALHAAQTNLFGQVSKTENASYKTWFSYDEFGRLTWSKQSLAGLGYKTVDYTYDFVGNVTKVAYQQGQPDAFYHHYVYDADNRLTEVHTSKDDVNKTLRSRYYYYLHGPLKRVELMNGTTKVQGLDYVYTIQGALKSINHADNDRDPGNDGNDAFGELITYYDNDYQGAGYSAGNQTLATYTDQFGGAIKGMSWHGPADNQAGKNTYAYTYDPLYQFNKADWGSMTGSAGSYAFAPTSAYKETVTSYDKNGNINALQRTGKEGNPLGNYGYVYEADKNRLDKINNSGSLLVDYTYNAIGQMTEVTEAGKTMKVKYTVHGLVKEIRNGSDQLLMAYNYDDMGNRVQKTIYTAGVAAKTTFYVYDGSGNVMAIYEQALPSGAVQLAEVPLYGAGRFGIYKPADKYFYEVSDHLGNVRAVIGLPSVESYVANFEDKDVNNVNTNNPNSGINTFTNYSSNTNDQMDHTDAGTAYQRVQLLNGGTNGRVGLAKSMMVSPGDKVKIDVYAKYRNLTGSPNSTSLIAALASVFNVSPASTGEKLTLYNNLNSFAAGVPNGDHPLDDEGAPKVFATILLFDKNYKLVDAAWDQIDAAAMVPTTSTDKFPPAHDLMTKEINVTQPGYAYVFLSNEHYNYVDVYFDDLTITHTQSQIVAGSDYYPFGLVMGDRSITDEPYRYGYQGQYAEKNDSTGWNEFELRMYDARFGRWLSVDPEGQFWSPYVGMGNNPVSGVDPTGGLVPEPIWDAALKAYVFQEAALITASSVGSIAGKLPAIASILIDNGRGFLRYTGTDNNIYESYNYRALTYKLVNNEWQIHRDEEKLNRIHWANLELAHTRILQMNMFLMTSAMGGFDGALANTSLRAGANVTLNIAIRAAKTSSQILSWGSNAKGHLIKHADVLGFGGNTPQQLQKMLPQLRGAANQLLNNANPALTRVGQWHGYQNAIMYISNGKMLVTEANGSFMTVINKTANQWYNAAKPLR